MERPRKSDSVQPFTFAIKQRNDKRKSPHKAGFFNCRLSVGGGKANMSLG
jgi:hypothetical protein